MTARTCSTRTGWSSCPVDLAEGDEVRLLSAGAYTSCYSSVGFNGFAPLPTIGVTRRVDPSRDLDAPTRRVIASHAIAALAVALPWPLLLVLVDERSNDPLLLGLVGAARMLPYVLFSWATASSPTRCAGTSSSA